MSKTSNSDLGSWLPDIPLRQRTSTTSDDASLILTERSTGTGAERLLVWAVLAAIGTSAIVSACVGWFIFSRMDGQRWIGWTQQIVEMKGKTRRVLIPLFMTPNDLKELQEEGR